MRHEKPYISNFATVNYLVDGKDGAPGAPGADGVSAVIADLDNEVAQFGVDADGKVLSQQVLTTHLFMYYGVDRQALTALSGTLKYADGSSVATSVAELSTAFNGVTGTIGVTVKLNATITQNMLVELTATCAKGTRTVQWSLSRVASGRAGLAPDMYELFPSTSAFAFYRNNNALTPRIGSISIWMKKIAGRGSVSIIKTATSGYSFAWGFDDGSDEGTGNIGGTITVSAAQAASHDVVWVELYSGSTCIDREALPIVKEGAKGSDGAPGAPGADGADAVAYQIRLVNSTMNVSPNGIIGGGLTWNVVKIVGSSESLVSSATGVYFRYVGNGWSGSTQVPSLSSPIYGLGNIGIGEKWREYPSASSNMATGIEIWYTLSGTVKARLVVPITIMGQMSRNLYYAGIWSSFAGTWQATDYKAPYFGVVSGNTTTYWAFVGENGTWDKTDARTPSDSNTNWRRMTDEFSYIISNGVMTDFALLGGGVFNQDNMFSQYGYMLGYDDARIDINDNSQYQNVNPNDMFGVKGLPEYEDDELIMYSEEYDSSLQSADWVKASTLIPTDSVTLSKGVYYSFKLYGSGNFSWKLAASKTATGIISGTINDQSKISQSKTFLATSDTTYDLWVKNNNNGVIGFVYMCPCRFIPRLVMNWRTGESMMSKLFLRAGMSRLMLNITQANHSNYLFKRGQTEYLAFIRMASNSRFTGQWSGNIPTVYFPQFSELNEQEKDIVRGMAGQDFVFINDNTSNKNCQITGSTYQFHHDNLGNSFVLEPGKTLVVRCDYGLKETIETTTFGTQRIRYGEEEVKWRVRFTDWTENV